MTNTTCFITARFTLPSSATTNCKHENGDGDGESALESTIAATGSTTSLQQRFDETNCKTMLLGLPPGVKPSKPQPGNYHYSGMHDHGPMHPPPKEGGNFGLLVSLASEARTQSDSLLTRIIEEEKRKDKDNKKQTINNNKMKKKMNTASQGRRQQQQQQKQMANNGGLSTTTDNNGIRTIDSQANDGQQLKKAKVASMHDC